MEEHATLVVIYLKPALLLAIPHSFLLERLLLLILRRLSFCNPSRPQVLLYFMLLETIAKNRDTEVIHWWEFESRCLFENPQPIKWSLVMGLISLFLYAQKNDDCAMHGPIEGARNFQWINSMKLPSISLRPSILPLRHLGTTRM